MAVSNKKGAKHLTRWIDYGEKEKGGTNTCPFEVYELCDGNLTKWLKDFEKKREKRWINQQEACEVIK